MFDFHMGSFGFDGGEQKLLHSNKGNIYVHLGLLLNSIFFNVTIGENENKNMAPPVVMENMHYCVSYSFIKKGL